MARHNYYLPENEVEQEQPCTLVGMHDIAAALGLTDKQLRNLLYPDKRLKTIPPRPPVKKVPGLGLAADRDALLRWRNETLLGAT